MSMNYLSLITADLWLMEATALENLVQRLSDPVALKSIAAMEHPAQEDDDAGYAVSDGVAHIAVVGTLMKSAPEWLSWFGIDATSYLDVAAAIADAGHDPNVRGIMLDIDSPGGSAAGIHAMADCIAACEKPIRAHIDSLGASGAYWMASQSDEVTAGRGAQIGSIGAYTARVDYSRAAENAGVKVHLISSGVHKGAGYPGTAISPEQLAEVQASIDALAAEFVADVARGRGASPDRINESADGRIFSPADAQARGLIDRITSDPHGDWTRQMATSDATDRAYLKSGLALCREFPKHATLINEALDKGSTIEVIRGDIAIAEKTAQDAAEKAALVAEVAAGKAALKTEQDAHTSTKATLASVQRERDALTLLKSGTEGAGGVKGASDVRGDPAQHAIPKKTQAEVDALPAKQRAGFLHLVAKGEAEVTAISPF